MRGSKGYALVELIMVMCLLVLFGMTIFTLMYSGAGAQERIMNEKRAQTDARIAISYINVRLRQNDTEDRITVEKLGLTGKNAIVIKERAEGSEYDTWIYSHNGKLMECLVDPGAYPTEIDSFHIADIEDLDTVLDSDNGSVTNTVYYCYGDSVESMSATVYLRSYRGER